MTHPTTVVPHLVVHDGAAAVEFYKSAVGATDVFTMPAPDGKRLMHASMTVGGGKVFLCDDFPEHCDGKVRAPKTTGTAPPVTLHLIVPDADAAIDRAVKAGATATMPVMDAFWGDRYGRVMDPFGYEWSFASPLTPDRAKAAAAKGMAM